MEGRRKWDNNRRSQNRKPPRGSWQRTVPSWEKEFCKVVGLVDWETLLQMKKFTHLYDDVLKWDDSAGEEAFKHAKKRYWAEINGFSCDIPLPDPNLYIDEINWASKTDPDLESRPVTRKPEEPHDPVVIFGDSLMSNQESSPNGWGEDEDKLDKQHSSPSHAYLWGQNRGILVNNVATGGRGEYEEKFEASANQRSSPNHGASWGLNSGILVNNEATGGWGEDEEKLEASAKQHSSPYHGDSWGQNRGILVNNGETGGWGEDEEKLEASSKQHSSPNHGDSYRGTLVNNGAIGGRPGYSSSDMFQLRDGSAPGYVPWIGDWNYGYPKQGLWSVGNGATSNAGGTYASVCRDSGVHRENGHFGNHLMGKNGGHHKAPYWGKGI